MKCSWYDSLRIDCDLLMGLRSYPSRLVRVTKSSINRLASDTITTIGSSRLYRAYPIIIISSKELLALCYFRSLYLAACTSRVLSRPSKLSSSACFSSTRASLRLAEYFRTRILAKRKRTYPSLIKYRE